MIRSIFDTLFLTNVLGCFDIAAGFAMVWSWLRITTTSGLRTSQARWALFRRFVYAAMSIALFGLGIGRINNDYVVLSTTEFAFHVTLVSGILIFPLLRATGWITQDAFVFGDVPRRTG